jgi:hypothetical protein
MEGKTLGKKQTLTYLKGYANEAPVMATDGCPSPSKGLISATTYGSPKSSQLVDSTLPKWVEQDKKVQNQQTLLAQVLGSQCYSHPSSNML